MPKEIVFKAEIRIDCCTQGCTATTFSPGEVTLVEYGLVDVQDPSRYGDFVDPEEVYIASAKKDCPDDWLYQYAESYLCPTCWAEKREALLKKTASMRRKRNRHRKKE